MPPPPPPLLLLATLPLQGGAVDDVLESLVHGRARKSARSGNDSLSYNAFRAKTGSKKK